MPATILTTKLYKPVPRTREVQRVQLIERLNARLDGDSGNGCGLILFSAAAGFGKTTVVSQWIHQLSVPVAWLSLEQADSDPARFLSYVVAAIQTVAPQVGLNLTAQLQSSHPPPPHAILTTLLNEIAEHAERLLLVLDDYHAIDAKAVDDAVAFMLDRLPAGMHVVIATREDPPLPLARYRVQDNMTEVRATDLRFSPSEAAAFLNQMHGLHLSEGDIAALASRTEGWIAGLQLAALSMQGQEDIPRFIATFTGSNRYVLDYLLEEVLDRQSDSVQAFLLQTAILDRQCGSLCDALTGHTDGQATLEMLERTNLFLVPLDDERRWYRYHHLFADLLLRRLSQSRPELVPLLHRRAGDWYEQAGLIDEAIEHRLHGEQFERAATQIEENYAFDFERGEPQTLSRWLNELPDDLISSMPPLTILHAWLLFTSGRLEEAVRCLDTAESLLAGRPFAASESSMAAQTAPNTNKLLGKTAAMRAFVASYSGDAVSIIQYGQQALQLFPQEEHQWRAAVLITMGDAYANAGQMEAAHESRADALATVRGAGDVYMQVIINLRLAEILREQGDLRQVVEICERVLAKAEGYRISDEPVVGWLHALWGDVLAEWNRLDEALAHATQGVEMTSGGEAALFADVGRLCLARILFSRGDLPAAEQIVQSMGELAADHQTPVAILLRASAWRVRIGLAQGKLAQALAWAAERKLKPDDEVSYLHEPEYIALSRVLIADGRPVEALGLSERLLEATKAGGRTSTAIEILILQALAHHGAGDMEQAVACLAEALSLAAPGGFVRAFVDEGAPMARLLCEALERGIAPEQSRLLLAAMPDTAVAAATANVIAQNQDLVEPLTERELEVLHLIAAGLSNAQIAGKLVISPQTVKVHTRNINGKLDAHNRTEAVAKARSAGLLPFA